MTGFGAAEAVGDGCRIHVELRSVNHRFLDISLRLPRPLLAFEDTIKSRLRERVDRGRVSMNFGYETRDELEEIALNKPLVQAYIDASRQVAEQLGSGPDSISDPANVGPIVAALLSQPDVLTRNFKAANEDQIRSLLNECIDDAINQADQMKEREGKSLGEDLRRRLDLIVASLGNVERLAPRVPDEAKANLRARLAKLTDGGEVDAQRLAQEVAILADRSDITEECVRLRSHLKQFGATMRSSQQGARRMGFLLQEMHREVNTIGSKTGTLEITSDVIAMKEEIEKLREQVQNLE